MRPKPPHLLPLLHVASTSSAAANVGKFQQFKLISNRLHNYAAAAVRRVSGRTLKRVDLVSIWSRLPILVAIVRNDNDMRPIDQQIDHNDGQFFRAMEWLMFFFQATIELNGFSMVLTTLDHHH